MTTRLIQHMFQRQNNKKKKHKLSDYVFLDYTRADLRKYAILVNTFKDFKCVSIKGRCTAKQQPTQTQLAKGLK